MAKKKCAITPSTAARLKRLRQHRGITQERLAELVDRCEQSIRLYENGYLGISPRMLEALAAALDTTAEYLATGRIENL